MIPMQNSMKMKVANRDKATFKASSPLTSHSNNNPIGVVKMTNRAILRRAAAFSCGSIAAAFAFPLHLSTREIGMKRINQ